MFFLVAVAIGGVAWVFLYPLLSGERKAEKRKEVVSRSGSPLRVRATRRAQRSRAASRSKAALKELEDRNSKAKSVPLSIKIAQAGLTWSKRRFLIICAATRSDRVPARLIFRRRLGGVDRHAVCCQGCGMPFWLLRFLKKRREAKFLQAFPDAVDIIVRGIKAGLPLLDSLQDDHHRGAGTAARASFAPSSRPRRSAFRSAKPAASSTSAFRCRRRTSSASSSRFSRRPAAICPRRWATCRACCASARR